MPSAQGTQAAVRAIVDAHGRAGADATLLTYGYGAAGGCEGRFRWVAGRADGGTRGAAEGAPREVGQRAGDRRLRSGPSLRKLVEDARLVGAARRLLHALRPDVVFAHHVEAMLVAWAATRASRGDVGAGRAEARRPALVFVAHTELAPELPAYLPAGARPLTPLVSGAGALVDRVLVARADAALAVAPDLAARLSRATGRDVGYLPLPWEPPMPLATRPSDAGRATVGAATDGVAPAGNAAAGDRAARDARRARRASARTRLGLPQDARVVAYLGNVDGYQGVEGLVAAVGILRAAGAAWRLLLATAGSERDVEAVLARGWAGDARAFATRTPLCGERARDDATRDAVYEAADVIAVPRALRGGVPVKLLDALTRGVPVVATARALAGLPVGDAVRTCADDSPAALARALDEAVRAAAQDPVAEAARAARALDYVVQAHAPARCAEALAAATAVARRGPSRAVTARPRA
jgi:glycosyltransferase involved in cell wall biosynthesis